MISVGRVHSEHVYKPGSSVPGPPFGPKRTTVELAVGSSADRIDATSKVCADAAAHASKKNAMLIFSGSLFRVIDHEHIYGSLLRFEPQPKLRLNRAHQRDAHVAIGVERSCRVRRRRRWWAAGPA